MEQITLKNSVLVVKKQHDFVADNVSNRMKSSKKKKSKIHGRLIIWILALPRDDAWRTLWRTCHLMGRNLATRKMSAGISFFMVSSSDLKYKLMRHVTFNPLLFWIAPGLISCIFIWNKKKISVVQFLSRHFSVYNFLYFWALSTLDDGQ